MGATATHTISVMLAVSALCYLLPSTPFPTAAAATETPDLAIAVCKNTSDFDFCRAAIYSDPHTPGADRFELIDTVFRLAYRNASDTIDYIAGEIKSGGGGGAGNGLKKCLADYKEVDDIVGQVLNDLNSESYYDLDTRSLDIERAVSDCRKRLRAPSPLVGRNRNMFKIGNICFVVSKLFEYH